VLVVRALKVLEAVLYKMRCLMGSQCRCQRRSVALERIGAFNQINILIYLVIFTIYLYFLLYSYIINIL